MSEENKNGPAAPAAKKPATQMPKLHAPKNRLEIAFRHDVFKSDIKKCLRNMSYEHLKFEKLEVEHVHVYHSHKNDGRRLTRTNSACGHWHNIEHIVDPDTGGTMAVCGPPMHEVTRVSETGRTYTVVEQVSYDEEITVGERAGTKKVHKDDHRHEMLYVGSEELSPAGIASSLKEQRALATAMGMSIDPSAVKSTSPAPLTPAEQAEADIK